MDTDAPTALPEAEFAKELRAALAFQLTPGLTPSLIHTLLSLCGDFQTTLHTLSDEQAVAALYQQLSPGKKARLKEIARALTSHLGEADQLLEKLQAEQITTLLITHSAYPKLLKELSTPPPLLFVQGDPDILHLPQIGVIGSRGATTSGLNTARRFARQLAQDGLTVTSGMALGIDGAAHWGAIEAGGAVQSGGIIERAETIDNGKTIAVLGTGLDVLYPKAHGELREQILQSGGALVSEFLPGTQPRPKHFPQRNRIISGLGMGVLVVEAAIKSGSLITARYALNQGREVFALPGSIHSPVSKGCHQLIREGATLVETSQDIIRELGALLGYKANEAGSERQISAGQHETASPAKNQCPLLAQLGFDPISIDSLIKQTGMDAAEVSSRLLQLELKGVVSNEQGMIVRIAD